MGNGEWGMGNRAGGQGGRGRNISSFLPMPYALCPMPNYQLAITN
ncbi:hypothetical protein [Tolypothrix sp. VBCCA 56010]